MKTAIKPPQPQDAPQQDAPPQEPANVFPLKLAPPPNPAPDRTEPQDPGATLAMALAEAKASQRLEDAAAELARIREEQRQLMWEMGNLEAQACKIRQEIKVREDRLKSFRADIDERFYRLSQAEKLLLETQGRVIGLQEQSEAIRVAQRAIEAQAASEAAASREP